MAVFTVFSTFARIRPCSRLHAFYTGQKLAHTGRTGKKYTEDKHDTFIWRIIKKIKLGENMLEAGKNLQNAINSYSQLTDTIKNANKVKTPEFSDVNAQTMTADTGDAEKENDKKEEI